MKIAVIQDKIKGVWRSLTTGELKDVADDKGKEFTPNRAMRRAWWVRTRLRGSGYTRPFHGGSEKREPERPRRLRGRAARPLTPEEDHRLRMEAVREATLRAERAERRAT